MLASQKRERLPFALSQTPGRIESMKEAQRLQGIENAIILVKDGKMEQINPPESGYGEHTFTWRNGKVVSEKCTVTKKHD